MRVRVLLASTVLAVSVGSCQRSPEAIRDERIAAVEHGLLHTFGDFFWKRMNLLDRMEHHRVPGVSIALIDNLQIEWAKGYGVLAAGGDAPVTPDTLFQAASLGKPVVAVAALRLVQQGDLELDRDVNEYLTSWKVPESDFTKQEKVTLRRLLSHSAGVTVEGFRGYAVGEDVPGLPQVLDGTPPANSPPIRVDVVPGTTSRYSGGGYMIVQQLLEDLTGEPFPDILEDSIFEPWGMTASTFRSPLPGPLEPLAASGHRGDGSTIRGGWHTYPEMGSGASLWSTPSDLARFAIHVMRAYHGESDAVLSHEMAMQMLTPQVGGRGLGYALDDDGGDLFYFLHDGANDGYKTFLVGYPKRRQGVVIMTNGDNGGALWREILNGVSMEYGWVRDRTSLYTGVTLAVALIFLGFRALRRRRARRNRGP